MEKDIENKQAIEKFKKLVSEINVCMFISSNEDENHIRPMATIEVGVHGTLWLFTDIRSVKVGKVSLHRDVHLVYAYPGKESYLDVWGKAFIITGKRIIKTNGHKL